MRLVERALKYALPTLAVALIVADIVTCGVVPWRLRYGEHGSFYTFGFVGDEYAYAEHIEPLVKGAARSNTVNGVTDPRYISMYYLEDLLRAVVTATRIDIVRFVWMWRALFPIGLMASLFFLVDASVPTHGRRWGPAFQLAVTGALFPFLFWGYEKVTTFPPLGGWIYRFPTGCEYVLALLLAWAFVQFLERKTPERGATLAALSVAMVYLRPYATIAWAPAIGLPMAVLFLTRKIPTRTTLTTLAVLVVPLVPWYAIKRWDSKLPVYDDLFKRYLDQPTKDLVHEDWKVHVGFAAAFVFLAWRAKSWWKPYALGVAAALLILPFNAHWFPMARELMQFDRFGVLYLVAAAGGIALWIGQRTIAWKPRHALLWSLALLACGAWACRSNWKLATSYDLAEYPLGPLRNVEPDLARIPAYLWVRDHTPPGALFLEELPSHSPAFDKSDLFGVIARRRRVFTFRLYVDAIPQDKFVTAKRLYQATMGEIIVSPVDYAHAYTDWSPEYILWRKDRPIPHGTNATLLLPYREVVYSDEACEIWKMGPVDLDQVALESR